MLVPWRSITDWTGRHNAARRQVRSARHVPVRLRAGALEEATGLNCTDLGGSVPGSDNNTLSLPLPPHDERGESPPQAPPTRRSSDGTGLSITRITFCSSFKVYQSRTTTPMSSEVDSNSSSQGTGSSPLIFFLSRLSPSSVRFLFTPTGTMTPMSSEVDSNSSSQGTGSSPLIFFLSRLSPSSVRFLFTPLGTMTPMSSEVDSNSSSQGTWSSPLIFFPSRLSPSSVRFLFTPLGTTTPMSSEVDSHSFTSQGTGSSPLLFFFSGLSP
ncbi:hypothetical protein EYF80_053554 [Liparis tanakae]|uniref:Uncharacterized protein n=1 Tax=Liparis tanakae TaxID=230148 RepID=A0A4Z2F691_9TELE|nr:hypothetical protein EYF80_053554 [Liparis tanakae]